VEEKHCCINLKFSLIHKGIQSFGGNSIGTVLGAEPVLTPTADIATVAATPCGSNQLNSVIFVLLFAVEKTSCTDDAIVVLLAVHALERDAALPPSGAADNFGARGREGGMGMEISKSEQELEELFPEVPRLHHGEELKLICVLERFGRDF
jgi:hypothetical protein